MKSNLAYSYDEENIAYIGVGSNLGDKRGFCLTAMRLLAEVEGVRLEARSGLYSSAPIGDPAQDWYVNAVVRIRTSLTPQELLFVLHEIEDELRRSRDERWGPRTIDLDILFYNAEVIVAPDLRVPHPEAHRRTFVLMPLNEIAPSLVHPEFNCTVATLLQRLQVRTACFPFVPRAAPFYLGEVR